MLNGRYADGTSWKAGTRLIHMTRADGPVLPCPAASSGQARVVVYREHRIRGRFIKPSFYCDDAEAALIYPGEYFTIALTPGKHNLSSSDQYTSVPLDAEAGSTYYVKVSLSKSEPMRPTFKVELVDVDAARRDLQKAKPAQAGHISRNDIVTANLPPK